MPTIEAQLKAWLKGARSVVVIGVGNPMLGDDGAGVLVARRLASRRLPEKLKVLEGGVAPENMAGKAVKYNPTHILLVDAAAFKGRAGSLRLFPIEQVAGLPLSTHRLPLTYLAEYLQHSLPYVKISLLAVKPKKVGWGLKPTREVLKAVERAVKAIFQALKEA